MKVCIVQEDETTPYKVVYASMSETPYRILKDNGVFYETRDIFLNGKIIDNGNILKPLSSFKFQENTAFIAVRKKM